MMNPKWVRDQVMDACHRAYISKPDGPGVGMSALLVVDCNVGGHSPNSTLSKAISESLDVIRQMEREGEIEFNLSPAGRLCVRLAPSSGGKSRG